MLRNRYAIYTHARIVGKIKSQNQVVRRVGACEIEKQQGSSPHLRGEVPRCTLSGVSVPVLSKWPYGEVGPSYGPTRL